MDGADGSSACTFKTGCDKNDKKFPYTDAKADDVPTSAQSNAMNMKDLVRLAIDVQTA